MRAIMAVSADGYVARHEDDYMDWLGPDDKALFRVLTSVGGECYAGRKTAELMPATLQGRALSVLSRRPGGIQLDHLRYSSLDGAWLLGGQDIVLAALALTLVDVAHLPQPCMVQELHLCRSSRFAFPVEKRYFDRLTPLLITHGLSPALTTKFGDVRHELWRIVEPVR